MHYATLYYFIVYGCIPFDYNSIAQNIALQSHYALGENTLKSQPISISNTLENRPIDGTSDLFCYDFDSSCRWHNLDNLFIHDDLKWFRGNGFLDRNRLQVSTGTDITPDGSYSIVATDQIQAPNSKATLVSDVITCQVGVGELRFMYWISPEVRLTVCLKRISQSYPNFDFCTSPIRGGSPGPAQISIDDLGNEPFQILIQADNFVFHSGNLEGGFAIIDNLEYYGDLCFDPTMLPIDKDIIVSHVMYDESESTGSPGPKTTFTDYKSVCNVLQCTFDDDSDQCSIDTSNSMWSIARPSSDGIRIESNSSGPFYDPADSFIYIVGPVAKARLHTAPFQSIIDFNLLFSYYKTSNNPKLRAIIKMREKPTEKTVFTALMWEKQNKHWYRELISLEAGIYDYVAIEIQNLDDDQQIGIDEFLVLDSQKRPMCSQQRNS
ncbi:unnamed protein product [Cercopithifilaria johnstoni]|uniref:MAM domain-containing protein n=1 Tax=Cercopithifilaria johnstoni TaxID=2874296 RepID=A0A8J2M0E7_9BILA|nr:unnamed protein product [Cercopithifilaria johnstoni]